LNCITIELYLDRTNESVPLGDIWLMTPDDRILGPIKKQDIQELKDSGRPLTGFKTGRSKDGPWVNLEGG